MEIVEIAVLGILLYLIGYQGIYKTWKRKH